MKFKLIILVILLLFFSCQKKPPIKVSSQKNTIEKDTLELLFSNSLSDGRFHEQYSRISLSDSILFISSPIGESELYSKGKLILKKRILNYNEFDSITKQYHLLEIDPITFANASIHHSFNENIGCNALKQLKSKILSYSILKSKSGAVFQYLETEGEIPKLMICYLNKSYIFYIKNEEFGFITYDENNKMNYTKSTEEISSYIKLIDITGDGKEELFIFYDSIISPVIFFDVYEINYLEYN